jgi:hypothetical protein
MEKNNVYVIVTQGDDRTFEHHTCTEISNPNENTTCIHLQKAFYDDFVGKVTMAHRAPEGFKVGDIKIGTDNLRGQIIHAFADAIRHIECGIFPEHIDLLVAKSAGAKLRLVWHKNGAATLILPPQAKKEIDRTLMNMGGFWFEALTLQEMVNHFNDTKNSKSFNAYYYQELHLSNLEEEGYKGNGSPRLVSLLTLLAYMECRGKEQTQSSVQSAEEPKKSFLESIKNFFILQAPIRKQK